MSGDVTKLPLWAREHIASVERQRDAAVRALNAFTDRQTPSAVYTEEHPVTGEGLGPVRKRNYLQTDEVAFEASGVRLTVRVVNDGLRLQWSDDYRTCGECAFIPQAFQCATIKAQDKMRPYKMRP